LELDDQAQIISYEEYTPYGSTSYHAVRRQTETPKRYRYTGKERDEESGLYYHGARYYVAWLGRWNSCDPIGIADHINLFAYAACSPSLHVDPTGTFSKKKFDDWLAGEVASSEKAVTQATNALNVLKEEKTATEGRLSEIDAQLSKLTETKNSIAASRKPLESKPTKRTADEEKQRQSLRNQNNEIVAQMTQLSKEKAKLASTNIRLGEKIIQQEAVLNNEKVNLKFIKTVKANYEKAYAKATKGLSKEAISDLEILTNVVMNEAGNYDDTAKGAIASAHLNDKKYHMNAAGHLITPSDTGNGGISHYSDTASGKNFEAATNKADYIVHLTESIAVAHGRLDKTKPVTDPTGGATRWVSPDAMKALGIKMPGWTKKMTEVIVPGIPKGTFTFYR
jgi:RHS repeat-associated protein